MPTSRRTLIAAAAALLAPARAFAAWPRARAAGPNCRGRVAYAGGPLRAQLDPAVFDAAAQAAAARLTPFASDDLDLRLDKAMRLLKARTLSAAVVRADGTLWTQSLATGGPSPQPGSFVWPGLADVFVATAALQLVDEGKLSLEATIERWAPEIAAARWITVEDLLGHTTGLAATLQPGGAPAAAYCPGLGWSQVGADYALLSRIVGALDGRPGRDAVAARTIGALELRETVLAEEVTASAADVARFWRAALGGRLTTPSTTRRRFLRLYPMTAAPVRSWWGLGVMVQDLAADAYNPADVWLGSSRAQGGAAAAIAWSPRRRAIVAVALTGDGSPDSAIDLLLLGVPADPKALTFTPVPPRPVKPRRRRRRS